MIQDIISEIELDFAKGVYNQFPKLKNKLTKAIEELSFMAYMDDKVLSSASRTVLEENEYIDSNF